MDEYGIRELIGEVKCGRLSRRQFVQTLVGFGLTAPMAAQILTHAGLAQAQPKAAGPAPTRRGGGGDVKLLYWAAPTILNPHLAVAPKDLEASEIFYEPLADIDTEGNIVPVLAQEMPSVDNGGVGQGRHLGDLAPQARRALARRPPLHRRRRDLHLAVRRR